MITRKKFKKLKRHVRDLDDIVGALCTASDFQDQWLRRLENEFIVLTTPATPPPPVDPAPTFGDTISAPPAWSER